MTSSIEKINDWRTLPVDDLKVALDRLSCFFTPCDNPHFVQCLPDVDHSVLVLFTCKRPDYFFLGNSQTGELYFLPSFHYNDPIEDRIEHFQQELERIQAYSDDTILYRFGAFVAGKSSEASERWAREDHKKLIQRIQDKIEDMTLSQEEGVRFGEGLSREARKRRITLCEKDKIQDCV